MKYCIAAFLSLLCCTGHSVASPAQLAFSADISAHACTVPDTEMHQEITVGPWTTEELNHYMPKKNLLDARELSFLVTDCPDSVTRPGILFDFYDNGGGNTQPYGNGLVFWISRTPVENDWNIRNLVWGDTVYSGDYSAVSHSGHVTAWLNTFRARNGKGAVAGDVGIVMNMTLVYE